MKWLHCCCWWWWCERCLSLSSKPRAVDDAAVLIPDIQAGSLVPTDDTQPPAFYVPRRHSSYNTDTLYPVHVQPIGNSDSISSSEEDEGPLERGRFWSATDAVDVTSDVKHRSLSMCAEWNKEISVIDKHILSGIAESDTQEHLEPGYWTDTENYGYLTFITAYKDQEQKLAVSLDRATELPLKGSLLSYDTFVKVQVTSSRKNDYSSRTVKNSLNPVYNEKLTIPVNRDKTRTTGNAYLRLSLFDCDHQGRHDAIGHVILPMSKIVSQDTQSYTLPITPMSLPVTNIGQVLLGLAYLANQSRLSVHVIKGRHLRLDSERDKCRFKAVHKDTLNTFLKVTLMCRGKKVKTMRSRVVSESTDPIYNHKNNFVVPPQYLLESSVIVTVMARAILGRTLVLGRITSGPYTATYNGTLTHWGRMVQDTHSSARWRNICM